MKFSDFFKALLIFIIILQFAPIIVKNLQKQYIRLTIPHTKVAIVNITGTLKDSTHYIKQLKKFFEDRSIKSILLKINSSGGAVGASQALFNEIKFLKNKHPKAVVAYSSDTCLSGAYYVATAADVIVTTPSALVGSIGVFIPQPQLKELIEYWHVKYDVIKTGKFKTANNPLLEITPQERAMLQNLTDDTYRKFLEDVSECRSQLSQKNASSWADGKIFTGRQAKKIGLIDVTGSESTAEKEIREITPIEGKIDWVEVPSRISWGSLFGAISGGKSQVGIFIGNALQYAVGKIEVES